MKQSVGVRRRRDALREFAESTGVLEEARESLSGVAIWYEKFGRGKADRFKVYVWVEVPR